VGFDVTYQLLISFLHSLDSAEKWQYNETVHQLFMDFKRAYGPVRKEELFKILIRVWGGQGADSHRRWTR
jgi:hypothetical protein